MSTLFEKDEYSGCQKCYGSGRLSWMDEAECSECLGTGQAMSEIGRDLVTFLRQHYGLELKSRKQAKETA